MRITVITAFPDFLRTFFSTSIVGKGVEKGLLSAEVVDIRDYASGEYRQIDDYAFGGGGMLLMAEPLRKALKDVEERRGKAFVLGTSPQGALLRQPMVETLAEKDHLVIVCGHYEGMDERFVERHVDQEVSLGDFVLTGGELAAMVVIDSVSRRIPGVVGKESAVEEDSFAKGFLDHPHYTRPAVWDGMPVPEVLLSGNHEKILSWRRQEALRRTLSRRLDLVGASGILPYMASGVYGAFLMEREEAVFPEGLMDRGLRIAESYGLSRFCLVSSSREIRQRACSRESLKAFGSVGRLKDWIARREKKDPLVFLAGGNSSEHSLPGAHIQEMKRQLLERQVPALFIFEISGSSRSTVGCDYALFPLSGGKGQPGDFDPGDRMAIVLDRFFGCS